MFASYSDRTKTLGKVLMGKMQPTLVWKSKVEENWVQIGTFPSTLGIGLCPLHRDGSLQCVPVPTPRVNLNDSQVRDSYKGQAPCASAAGMAKEALAFETGLCWFCVTPAPA